MGPYSIGVSHYPLFRKNPYNVLMLEAIQNAGVLTLALTGSLPELLRFLFGRHNYRILHLHWVSMFVTSALLPTAVLKMCLFHTGLLIWRFRGRKIVWTVHNLVNHERKRLWLERLHSRLTASAADAVLVHGGRARTLVARTFDVPLKKIHIIPHGNYVSKLPEPVPLTTHEGVRFLCFGLIRRYKGIPALLSAFSDLQGSHTLQIAGEIRDTILMDEIMRQAICDSRVRLRLEFLPDTMLAKCLAECDVVVLPYLDILTSGSLLMALSAARASIVPHAGVIEDYTDDTISFLYNVAEPKGLLGALRRATESNDLAERGVRARLRAAQFDWTTIGYSLKRLYEQIGAFS